MQIATFTFGPFQENTFVVSDHTKECIIIDPGCYNSAEWAELQKHIENEGLNPVRLINTHAHIDHIFGNHYVCKAYGLLPEMHELDLPILEASEQMASVYGLNITPSPFPSSFLKEGDTVTFGETSFEILFLPGHAPGHIGLINKEANVAFTGDVLFRNGIGRTDLPFCNHNDLITAIREKLFLLDDAMEIHCGHGPTTTIGYEKKTNPFVRITE